MNTIIGNSVAKVITALAVMLGVLSNRLTNNTIAFLRPGHGKPGVRAAFLVVSLIAALIVTSPAAIAATGDITIDLSAAAPESYNHLIGGGAFDDGTTGVDKDIVESLEGGDFSCGDIVTFLATVTVDDTDQADTDAPQTIDMDFSFLGITTGQSGVGIGDIVLVQVNYGTIEDLIAGENDFDDGIYDDGGSTATLTNEYLTEPLFTTNSELHGTVILDDLERNETVVVRIDVKLFCDPNQTKKPSGGLQGALTDARLTFINGTDPVEPPEAISGGEQTIPFNKIREICFPELVIEKTVTDSDDCSLGVDELTVTSGDEVKYCYVVTNPNTCGAPLYNVKVVDDNGTPGNTADDFIVTLDVVGLSDEDGDGSSDDLAAGGTATGEKLITLVYTSELPVINTGTATGNDSIIEPTTLTDSDTAAVTVEGTPSINITKTMTNNADEDGSNDVSLGDTLNYTFDVTNDGDLNLNPVTVTDPMPGLSALSCDATSLVSGALMTCTATYTVTQADVDAGWINNTATATGSPTTGGDVTDTDDENVTVPQDQSINLTKTMSDYADEDGSGDVSLGDILTYTFNVTNDGNVNLTSVDVTDQMSGLSDITCVATSLVPGASTTCTATYTVTQADVNAGSIYNMATATGTPPIGDDVIDTDDEDVPVPSPSKTIEKILLSNADEDGSGDVSVGDTLTYQITVNNTGTANLTNVNVSDDLTGNSTTCALVIPGDTCVLTVTYVVQSSDLGTTINNVGTGDSDQTEPVTDEENVPVPSPSKTIEKILLSNADEDGSGDVSVGDTLTYQITVNNTGTANLTNVNVSDDLTGNSTTCPLVIPGDTCVLEVTYVVKSTDVGTTINNTGTADSDQTDPVTDDEDVPVPSPSQTVEKILLANADEDGSGDVSVGDTLTYQITATNNGTANLTNVNVSDDLTGNSTTCSLVIPGDTCVLEVTYVVKSSDLGTTINNTGTADSDQTDPVTDDDEVPVPSPSQTVEKILLANADEDNSGDVSVGDTLTYQITATNNGTANLTNVNISDDLTGNSTTCSLVIPGDTCVLEVTYVVKSSDLGTTINNTGTAESDQTDPITDDEEVPVPFPALAIEKTGVLNLGPDDIANPGDVITYSYNVTANGTANLTNVQVTDLLPGLSNITCFSNNPIPFLAAGATETCTATYQITQADIEAGHRNNTATADSDQTDPVQDNETVPIPQSPSIDVEKYVSVDGGTTWVDADDPTYPDMIFRTNPQFKFVVNNTGNVNLTGIILTDTRLDMSGCNVPDPLAVGVSYECFATDPWTPVLYNNTVNVTVNFGGQNYSDEDDAHYWAPSHVSP